MTNLISIFPSPNNSKYDFMKGERKSSYTIMYSLLFVCQVHAAALLRESCHEKFLWQVHTMWIGFSSPARTLHTFQLSCQSSQSKIITRLE